MKIFASVHELTANHFVIVALWGIGPMRLSGAYKTRDEARRAATRELGKDRKLVSLDRLYEIQAYRIKDKFLQSRKPKKKDDAIVNYEHVVDCFECNDEREDRIIPLPLRDYRYGTSRREDC